MRNNEDILFDLFPEEEEELRRKRRKITRSPDEKEIKRRLKDLQEDKEEDADISD